MTSTKKAPSSPPDARSPIRDSIVVQSLFIASDAMSGARFFGAANRHSLQVTCNEEGITVSHAQQNTITTRTSSGSPKPASNGSVWSKNTPAESA